VDDSELRGTVYALIIITGFCSAALAVGNRDQLTITADGRATIPVKVASNAVKAPVRRLLAAKRLACLFVRRPVI